MLLFLRYDVIRGVGRSFDQVSYFLIHCSDIFTDIHLRFFDILKVFSIFLRDMSGQGTWLGEEDAGNQVEDNGIEYPSSDEDGTLAADEKAVSWGMLATNIWYLIKARRWVKTRKFGKKLLVLLEKSSGGKVEAWCTERMSKDISFKAAGLEDEETTSRLFIKPLGLVPVRKGSKRMYHNYNLVVKKDKDEGDDENAANDDTVPYPIAE